MHNQDNREWIRQVEEREHAIEQLDMALLDLLDCIGERYPQAKPHIARIQAMQSQVVDHQRYDLADVLYSEVYDLPLHL